MSYKRLNLLSKFGLLAGVLIGASESGAQTLINLNSGTKTTVESLLSQGLLLVYFEKDCAICSQYLKNLQNCSDANKKLIRYVSVSTAAQTKEMIRKLPTTESIYLVKNRQSLKSVYATPTTMWKDGQKVGALNCQEVASLFKQKL